MFICNKWEDYKVLDLSNGEKLEDWGKYRLIRPDPQVIWNEKQNPVLWKSANGHYHRKNTGGGSWEINRYL